MSVIYEILESRSVLSYKFPVGKFCERKCLVFSELNQ